MASSFRRYHALGRWAGKEERAFFFEKKNQKTFDLGVPV
jgi:hypothetical protein